MSSDEAGEFLQDFLVSVGQSELEGPFRKALEHYLAIYGVIKQIDEDLLSDSALLRTSFPKLASLIEQLGFSNDQFHLFWIAKLYFLLPLPPGWVRVRTSMDSVDFRCQDVRTPFHPSIAYVLYLKDHFLKNESLNHEVRKLSLKNKSSIRHFFANDTGIPFIKQFHLAKDFRTLNRPTYRKFLNSKESKIPEPKFLQTDLLTKINNSTKDKVFGPFDHSDYSSVSSRSQLPKLAKPRPNQEASTLGQSLLTFKTMNKFSPFESKLDQNQDPPSNSSRFLPANLSYQRKLTQDMKKVRSLRKNLLSQSVSIKAETLSRSLCTPWLPAVTPSEIMTPGRTLISFKI